MVVAYCCHIYWDPGKSALWSIILYIKIECFDIFSLPQGNVFWCLLKYCFMLPSITCSGKAIYDNLYTSLLWIWNAGLSTCCGKIVYFLFQESRDQGILQNCTLRFTKVSKMFICKSKMSLLLPTLAHFKHNPSVSIAADYFDFYKDEEYPVALNWTQTLYFEVELLNNNNRQTDLVLDHCWMTTTPDRNSLPQWHVIRAG